MLRGVSGVIRWQYWILFLPVVLLVAVIVSPVLASWVGIPGEIRLFPGTELSFSVQFPFRFIDGDGLDVTGPQGTFSLIPESIGKHQFEIRLFGFIPVREMVVEVVPEIELYPGGHSIGVVVNPVGLVVSRLVPVRSLDGREHYPAANAGIQPGDLIISIGGQKVSRPEQVGEIVNQLAGDHEQIEIIIKRNERDILTRIAPVLSLQEDFSGNQRQVYLLGLLIEDPASGVGTLTFYDKSAKRYGALGHTITDGLGRSVEINEGSIVNASIDSVKQGFRGLPGEKLGIFETDQLMIGSIDKNTKFGIYGSLLQNLNQPYFNQPVPIALTHEVRLGPAKIYTVLQGDTIREFDVEITRVFSQNQPDDKGLIIRVTDPVLLMKTGGIIQGMSGSPIVQNGKLVGAITHVFINDPQMGYGSFIEWMVYEAGLATDEPPVYYSNLKAS